MIPQEPPINQQSPHDASSSINRLPGDRAVTFLVRLAPDLTLRSDRVRAQFLGRLYRNITLHLRPPRVSGWVQVEKKWSRIYVSGEDPAIGDVLVEVFGVHSIQPLYRSLPCRWDLVVREAVAVYGPLVAGQTFAVRVRRTGTHPFSSHELEKVLGRELLKGESSFMRPKGVDLQTPQVTVSLEIRGEDVFFLGPQRMGPSGLPVGSGGKALALVSGGFDSLVAAWLAHRRGLELDFLFFKLDSGSLVESFLKQNLATFHNRWSTGSRSRITVVDFKPVIDDLRQKVRPALQQVVLKRLFYRSAAFLASRWGYPAIVTGENLGQVSSQTLQNLAAIEDSLDGNGLKPAMDPDRENPLLDNDMAGNVPPLVRPIVLRPLLMAEKDEIIRRSHQIGTYEVSRQVPELCQLTQERPATRVPVERARQAEQSLDAAVLIQTLRQARTALVRDLCEGLQSSKTNGVSHNAVLPPKESLPLFRPLVVDHWDEHDILIDIRDEDSFQEGHLSGAVHVASYRLESHDPPLERNRSYVLYCQKGLLSALVAQALCQKGYKVKSLREGLARYSARKV